MKLLTGIIFVAIITTLSVVFAVEDRNRRRHGHGHGRNRRSHHHRHHQDEDWDEEEKTHSGIVHKKCRRSGMVALTFDDGVV